MDIRQLTTFQRVATLLSFTRAAAELNYAQSSVTGQIKGLENSLGVLLFDRLSGGIRLTPAGLRLLPYAERLIALADEARGVAGGQGLSGTLTIGTTESVISYRLPPVLEFFHRRFPRLRVVVRDGNCLDTLHGLRQGTLDIGLLTVPDTEHAGLHTAVLGPEPLVVAAAPTHPLASAGPIGLDQLGRVPALAPDGGCRCYRELFDAVLCEHGTTPSPVRGFGNIESTKQGVAAGLGVGLLPAAAVAAEIAEKSLVALDWQPPFELFAQLVWRRGQGLPREHQVLVDHTIAFMTSEQPRLIAA